MDKPTAIDIMSHCRYFGVKTMDSLYMTEVPIAGGRVDLMVIDLRTHISSGYEVKLTREDFLKDKKWHSYVPFFNQFYFAALPGVILAEELPEGIGLLEFRKEGGGTGNRALSLIKKAELIQPRFSRTTLGEAHMINVLMTYMRDFNWRAEKDINIKCAHCGEFTKRKDPRGLPFGAGDPRHQQQKDDNSSKLIKKDQ